MRQFIIRLMEDGTWAKLASAIFALALLEFQPVPLLVTEAYDNAQRASLRQDYESAAQSYHRALDYQPWQTLLLSEAAQVEWLGGDNVSAQRDLQALAATRPLTPQEHLWLGHTLADAGQLEAAQTSWQIAFDADLTDTTAYLRLIEWHLARQDWGAAAPLLADLAEQNPSDAAARYRLGLVLALDDPTQAQAHLEQATQLEPALNNQIAPVSTLLANRSSYDPAFFKAQLGILYLELEEWSLAEAAFAQALAFNPSYGEAMAYLGYARSLQGNEPGALPPLQQAAASTPGSPLVHYLTGLYWKQRHSWPEARTAFERAYDLDITNPGLAVEIANTHRAENQPLWAEIWLQEAVSLAGDDRRFQIALAQFYVDDEYKVDTAGLSAAQQAVAEAPNDGAAHDALGWAYFLLGNLNSAQQQLEQALLLDPSLTRAYFHVGTLFELQNQHSAAIEAYQTAVNIDPEGAFGVRAGRALQRLGSLSLSES